jgi:hypothetical protein
MFWPETVNGVMTGANDLITQPPVYSFYEGQQIDAVLTQAWSWLERNGFIARASGMNGRNGWMIFTKQGEKVLTRRISSDFGKQPSSRNRCYIR